MATQMQQAKANIITEEMRLIAKAENLSAEYIRSGVANGRIVIIKNNKKENIAPVAIGEGVKIKVSSYIGAYNNKTPIISVLDKVRVMQSAEVDIMIDNSCCVHPEDIRRAILGISTIPIGANPVIQAGMEAMESTGDIAKLTKEDIFDAIEKLCLEGADIISLNCGLTLDIVSKLKFSKRLFKINNPSGIMLACMMKANNIENPLYEYFDELLALIKPYDVTLMLNSALKSECTSDAFDSVEVSELVVFGELVQRARERDVQVIINGIGQVSLNKIPLMVQNIKEITDGAPLFVARANACDCALGYDNISSSIGSALAAYQGADMLNAIPSTDRLGNVNSANIREAIICSKIAAHCADLARGNVDVLRQNYKMSYARLKTDLNKQIENNIDRVPFDGLDYSKVVGGSINSMSNSMNDLLEKYFSK